MKLNKRMRAAIFAKRFEALFHCPICNSSMNVVELASMTCLNNHSFDFAKQGYVNLATRQAKTKYNKELFKARRKIIAELGFFNPLSHEIFKFIHKYTDISKKELSIIDMGCGEGSHLTAICEIINETRKNVATAVGIDLSKEAILEAAKNYSDKIWAVADLANTPFRDSQFDIILNILSPSNYMEFTRVLNSNGLIIKVVPGGNYLNELREAFFTKQTYSNEEIIERFRESFQVIDIANVHYTVKLDRRSTQFLIQMTPLTWSVTEEQVNAFLEEREKTKITVDLTILVGKK